MYPQPYNEFQPALQRPYPERNIRRGSSDGTIKAVLIGIAVMIGFSMMSNGGVPSPTTVKNNLGQISMMSCSAATADGRVLHPSTSLCMQAAGIESADLQALEAHQRLNSDVQTARLMLNRQSSDEAFLAELAKTK